MKNYKSLLSSFGLSIKCAMIVIYSLYWIPKFHKYPYKQRYIVGSAKCTTIPLSKLKTYIFTAVKEGPQSYNDTCYSRSGIKSIMWILKNTKDLLETLNSRLLLEYNSIKTYDFSTLYTSIPHS